MGSSGDPSFRSLRSLRGAAKELGIDKNTVKSLCKRLGVKTIVFNHMIVLDAEAMSKLRAHARPGRRRRAVPA